MTRARTRTCLTCKYEPDWGKSTHGEYARQCGKCKWDTKLPILPVVYQVRVVWITRFSDNSGIPANCGTWEPK